ncbi:MAG TPA: hypothetical protein VFQ70_03950 [Candidatus Saccharimonadaceae bacterium]|nr:hypothetical protein [Candidatus Saccharimonadaceae bacterium]
MKRVRIPTTEQPPRFVVDRYGELPRVPEDEGRTDGDRVCFTLGKRVTGQYFKIDYYNQGQYSTQPISTDTPLLNSGTTSRIGSQNSCYIP